MGQRNANSLLDIRVYTAYFPDGDTINIDANTAAEYIFHYFELYGNKFMLFKAIMDHKSTEKYFKKSEGYITHKNQAPEC